MRLLLDRGAEPRARDVDGRSPVDYASISEAIWPFFAGSNGSAAIAIRSLDLTIRRLKRIAAQGYKKSLKTDLIAKGIIRKIQDQPEHGSFSDKGESVSNFLEVVEVVAVS